MSHATLWKLPDNNGNMCVRARMLVNSEVYDETICVPISLDTDTDLDVAINNRITELQNGTTNPEASNIVDVDNVEQIVAPSSEVKL